MKLTFKFIFFVFFLSDSYATRIDIMYTNTEDQLTANKIKAKFYDDYHVPEKLIRVSKVSRCSSRDERFIELCLNEKSDLLVLNEFSLKQKVRSLEIFFTN